MSIWSRDLFPTHMRSGLQREVLRLYRKALRVLRTKPVHTRPKFLLTVRYAFRSQNVSPRDFSTIEFLLRRGKKQVEIWEDPSVRDCWVSEDMRDWEQRWRGKAL